MYGKVDILREIACQPGDLERIELPNNHPHNVATFVEKWSSAVTCLNRGCDLEIAWVVT